MNIRCSRLKLLPRTLISSIRRYFGNADRTNSTLLPLVHSASNLVFSPGPYSAPETIHTVRTRTTDENAAMEEVVVPFFISPPKSSRQSRPVGFLRPEVSSALQNTGHDSPSPWCFHHSPSSRKVAGPWAVSFAHGRIPSLPLLVKGWNDEQYLVYFPGQDSNLSTKESVAFSIERAALSLFGFANYGCLLTAFFKSPQTGETMIWVPRRSRSKKTWPGALDVTVGGGMGVGDTALSTIIRECAEEAHFDPTFVRSAIRSVGLLSYPNRSQAGWILPGLYYLFDLPLRPDGTPRPRVNEKDGEVEGFEVTSTREVREQFKPSSALALMDFLIRHGMVNDESDDKFSEVCMALRRQLVLPIPWR